METENKDWRAKAKAMCQRILAEIEDPQGEGIVLACCINQGKLVQRTSFAYGLLDAITTELAADDLQHVITSNEGEHHAQQ